jgi:hypothetical protein
MPTDGYIHLYRSLLRFCDVRTGEAKELLYALNTASIDSYAYSHPEAQMRERSPFAFCRRLDAHTVYPLCAWNLVPREDESAVCLMRDWALLPSA